MEEPYKSPQGKLFRFFKKSRDTWKKKCKDLRKKKKRLESQVAYYKEKNKILEEQIKGKEEEEIKLREENAVFQENKKKTADLIHYQQHENFPFRHRYSAELITKFLLAILTSGITLRGICVAAGIFLGQNAQIPAWSTVRLWLIRFGCFKLMRPKEIANDWCWIMDHTIQMGPEKCLLILGVRLSSWEKGSLSFEDVEVIDLIPVEKSNGGIVFEQLEKTISKTGIPREILADGGSDLKAGIHQFCSKYNQTEYIYDIKHKMAIILEKELSLNPSWENFCQAASQTRRLVQQTDLAPLIPPSQRAKSRYFNLWELVSWGKKIGEMIDRGQNPVLKFFKWATFKEKMGWVKEYQHSIETWLEMITVIEKGESFVRNNGLYPTAHIQLRRKLDFELDIQTEEGKKIKIALLDHVRLEGSKAHQGERFIGSSEVIESLFGKFKYLENDQAKKGLPQLILALPSFVSTTTVEVIKKCMENFSTKKALDWCHKTLGKTFNMKRRQAFG